LSRAVDPQQDQNRQVVWHNRNTNITIIGATANHLVVRKYDLDVGRMFTNAEDEGAARRAARSDRGSPLRMNARL